MIILSNYYAQGQCKTEFKTFLSHSMLLSYHMVGPVSDGLVPWSRNTLLGVSVTEAASFHYQVIDGEVPDGKSFVCGGELFGLAGTRLPLQKSDSDVSHPQLLLALHPERIQGLPLWEGTVYHLLVREREISCHIS